MTDTRSPEAPKPGSDHQRTVEQLACQFELHRAQLRAVAHRMLGTGADAEDAVQEAWIRLSRSDTEAVVNLGGWLTTVVARVCLDMLRSRGRRERTLDAELAGLVAESADARLTPARRAADPAAEAELADSVGLALLVVLDTLSPTERLVFVLHDLFGLPFEQIADIVDRSPAATRQLASRARRRVRASDVDLDAERVVRPERDAAHVSADVSAHAAHHRAVVAAFLTAARGGDLTALLELLDPDVVMRADAAAVAMGSPAEVRGARAVAETFSGRARGARLALFDGTLGAVWTLHGTPKVAFGFRVADGRVVAIDLLADEARLAGLDIDYLGT